MEANHSHTTLAVLSIEKYIFFIFTCNDKERKKAEVIQHLCGINIFDLVALTTLSPGQSGSVM